MAVSIRATLMCDERFKQQDASGGESWGAPVKGGRGLGHLHSELLEYVRDYDQPSSEHTGTGTGGKGTVALIHATPR
jgi:hypothetical protein